jgi:phosphohistidine phosphatase SixA
MAKLFLKRFFAACFVFLPTWALAQVPSLSMAEATKRLSEGGYVLLMRHAATEGLNDSADVKLSDCATQLKITPAGREEALKIGSAFQTNGIKFADVSSSELCRCQETAKLVAGAATLWPALNYFPPHVKRAELAQSAEMRAALAYVKPPKNQLWVTHQVNITAFTGYVPGVGEVVALKPNAAKPADPKAPIVPAFRFSPLK